MPESFENSLIVSLDAFLVNVLASAERGECPEASARIAASIIHAKILAEAIREAGLPVALVASAVPPYARPTKEPPDA